MTPEQAARLAAMSEEQLEALLSHHGSSTVEQRAVNAMVEGSIPSRGAIQATATASAPSDRGEGLPPLPPLTPAQRKQEGRIKGGLTTWNLYRRVPPGRKKLLRINRKDEAGQPRGSEQRRGGTPSGSRAGTRR